MGRLRHMAVALLLGLALLTGATGVGQAAGPQAKAVREKVYERLDKAQKATENGDFAEAFNQLERLAKMRDLESHEKAQMHTTYGYTYFAQEKYAESAAAYGKVLEQPELSEAMRTSTLYTLAQLQFHLEEYATALDHLDNWLAIAANPGPEPYIMKGQALYQLERLSEAAAPIERAIAIAGERGQTPRENWYALLRVIHFETENFPALLDVLEILVTEYPAKEYWMHLASAFGEMGETARQLAAYEAAYALGYLQSSTEIVLLCQLLLQAEVPYRAGDLLQQGLDGGTVENTAGNWRLLSQAWILAQEHDKAIASLGKAAELSDDAELYARIAQSYANLNQWSEAITAAQTALDKGAKNPQDLQMMQGMAHFELGDYLQARTAFSAAQRSELGRATATRWLAYVEREQARLRELGLEP